MAFESTFFPVMGRSSCKLRRSAGMLNNTQCTQVLPGASGSPIINAKDCVLAGGSFQARGGEIFLPTHEYFDGMDCPLANASLVNLKDISASVVGSTVSVGLTVGADVVVGVETAQAENKMNIKTNKNMCMSFMPNPRA